MKRGGRESGVSTSSGAEAQAEVKRAPMAAKAAANPAARCWCGIPYCPGDPDCPEGPDERTEDD